MSSVDVPAEDDHDDVTKGELVETVKAQAATIDRLEEEVDELRERVDENDRAKVGKQAVNFLVDNLVGGGVDDFTTDPFEHRNKVERFNDRFEDVASTVKRLDSIVEEQGAASGNSKDVNWHKTVEQAQNAKGLRDHDLNDNWVALYKEDIAKATGLTERRAQQLIEEWGEEKEGADWRPHKRITSGRKTKSSNTKRKLLRIDLDVWGEDDD